jgi:hypothetical protein
LIHVKSYFLTKYIYDFSMSQKLKSNLNQSAKVIPNGALVFHFKFTAFEVKFELSVAIHGYWIMCKTNSFQSLLEI